MAKLKTESGKLVSTVSCWIHLECRKKLSSMYQYKIKFNKILMTLNLFYRQKLCKRFKIDSLRVSMSLIYPSHQRVYIPTTPFLNTKSSSPSFFIIGHKSLDLFCLNNSNICCTFLLLLP